VGLAANGGKVDFADHRRDAPQPAGRVSAGRSGWTCSTASTCCRSIASGCVSQGGHSPAGKSFSERRPNVGSEGIEPSHGNCSKPSKAYRLAGQHSRELKHCPDRLTRCTPKAAGNGRTFPRRCCTTRDAAVWTGLSGAVATSDYASRPLARFSPYSAEIPVIFPPRKGALHIAPRAGRHPGTARQDGAPARDRAAPRSTGR